MAFLACKMVEMTGSDNQLQFLIGGCNRGWRYGPCEYERRDQEEHCNCLGVIALVVQTGIKAYEPGSAMAFASLPARTILSRNRRRMR